MTCAPVSTSRPDRSSSRANISCWHEVPGGRAFAAGAHGEGDYGTCSARATYQTSHGEKFGLRGASEAKGMNLESSREILATDGHGLTRKAEQADDGAGREPRPTCPTDDLCSEERVPRFPIA